MDISLTTKNQKGKTCVAGFGVYSRRSFLDKGVNGSKLRSLRQVSCGAAPLSTGVINGFVHAFPNVDFIQVNYLGID